MAALQRAEARQGEASAELDRSRQEKQTIADNLEAEKRHTQVLSLQVKTLCQELQDCKSLEQAAQVHHHPANMQTLVLSGELTRLVLTAFSFRPK